MSNDKSINNVPQKKGTLQDDITDLKKILGTIISKWYNFVISLAIVFLLAYIYISNSVPVYRVSTTLLINDEKKGNLLGNNQFLEGLGLGEGMKNLDNQIMVLSSRTLIGRTLDDLPFETEYYHKRLNNNFILYPYSPIKIIPENAGNLPRDIEFTFKYAGNNIFNLKAESEGFFELDTLTAFGEMIRTPLGNFQIELSSGNWPAESSDRKIYFIFHSRKALVESYRERIEVDKISKTGTTLNISLEGTNQKMDMVFLDKLTEIFLNNSLDKKNQEAIRTIQFIDDQLIGISDSLVITENKLQQFRSRNKVMNLSAQGQIIINQAMTLENEKARLGVEANYYSYLAEYLSQDNVGEVPIAPATMGITDPGLTKLVADLAVLQGQYYSRSLGEKNPLQSQLAQRVSNTKEALKETLNGVIRANNMAVNEITTQIKTINAQATALPETERQLLGIERKYKLNDELYTFLLEKRAGAQIQRASNMPDNELIDPSESDQYPISPKTAIIYFITLFLGFGFPFFGIWVFDVFNNKLKNENDLKGITDMPVTGYIPRSLFKKNTIVLDDPQSNVAEAFRSMRSRMQFFTKETKTPVILITSSMPEEGKTFTAVNLASAYSLMGKKTILLGFDMRKPKIYDDFKISNEHGLSTWLIGKDELKDIIKVTSYKNLSIIPAGPIPPNPSELIALEKTEELLRLLKVGYECIIIDSPPVGMVSDTFHLTSLADTSILIVRQNKTLKDILVNTLNEFKIRNIKNLSVVINDLNPDTKIYGAGGKYGYN